jgi:malonyl-CoA O-methyltransferase
LNAKGFFVTGTDTGVGKTVVAALLCRLLEADYWKPIQAGTEGETDSDLAVRLIAGAGGWVHPPRHTLRRPRSPHEAETHEGIAIALDDFRLPESPRPIIVEGAGGVLVPLNRSATMADLMTRLGLPVLVVARTKVGTINHTLLTLEALRVREIAVAGAILNGASDPLNRDAIEAFGGIHVLAEVPVFPSLDARALGGWIAVHGKRVRERLSDAVR